jgi:hypothetical protein
MQTSGGLRRPLNWRIIALEELEGLGVTNRAAQARAMGVSLPHLDRIRRAARGNLRGGGRPARGERDSGARAARQRRRGILDPSARVSLKVRVPSAIVDRLKRYSSRTGISMALATAVALDDWLTAKGVAGPSGLGRNLRQRLGL